MENTPITTPAEAPATAPLSDLPLGDYRAQREGKQPASDPKTPATPKPESATGVGDAEELETASGTPEQQTEKRKKLGGFQLKISKQETEIAELKRQLAAGTPAAAKPADVPAAAAPAAGPALDYEKIAAKPKIEDCESLGEFTEKLADWTADRRDWLKGMKEKQTAQRAAATSLTDKWKTSEAEFKTQHDDYSSVLAAVDHIALSPAHQQIFLESENGVALAYELAQEPAELQRIAAMTPMQAALAIGKRAAALTESVPSEEPEPKVSAAPPPFKPVHGSSVKTTPDPAKLSHAEYRKQRESGRIQ